VDHPLQPRPVRQGPRQDVGMAQTVTVIGNLDVRE